MRQIKNSVKNGIRHGNIQANNKKKVALNGKLRMPKYTPHTSYKGQSCGVSFGDDAGSAEADYGYRVEVGRVWGDHHHGCVPGTLRKMLATQHLHPVETSRHHHQPHER
ncbi:unnamed protein product [Euphydryas editha]|uniref:Uncharacterized protein n=1 Tax=Euphydryas editha TaxID=104508 RepID=A0AAU9TZ20_EUPED|nr:unnamed protein product [Euphydryas editha]